jgi:PBSX family phage terminase large subunit
MVRISEIVAEPHLEQFNSTKLHQLDHGGRAGYKSSKNAIKIALQMLHDKHCEVVVVRQDYSDHKDSTFADLKIAFQRLGVPLKQGTNYPLGNDLWIKLPQGNYVHFTQMKDIDKLKGIRPRNPNNQIKIAWYFEITQFKEERYITEANATFMRGDKDYFYALYEWNDAPKLSHWTYDFKDKMLQREDAYVKKTNYNDAPEWQQKRFLGNIVLQEIERLKVIDPEQYKSTYLGFPANLSGTVYKQFNLDRNVKPATHEYMDITIGVDVGGNDATVYTARGVKPNYTGEEIFATYYHKNGVTGGIKNINEYVDDFLQFASEIYAKYKIPISVYIDTANLMFIQLVEEYSFTNDYGFIVLEKLPKMKRVKGANKAKSILQGRADMNEIKFGSGYTTIDPSCKQLIKAIQEREYNKKGEPADDGSSDVDSIDSYDYTWLKDMDFIYDIIMR